MLHSGIDLHKNDLVIDTLDASGTAVAHRRLRAQRHSFRREPAAPAPAECSKHGRGLVHCNRWLGAGIDTDRLRPDLGDI
jgi:hypothetical protein